MNKRMIVNILKKQWLLIWIAVVSLAMLTMIASAEYGSSTSNMHRVVVSKKGPGMMFSSNYLVEDGDQIYHPIYVKPQTEGAYDSNYLFMWNYNTSDAEKLYPGDIYYKLEVKLTDQAGNDLTRAIGNRVIIITDPLNRTVRLDNTTRSGSFEYSKSTEQKLEYDEDQAAQNRYTISFSEGWDISADEDICVQIKAVPTTKNGSDTGGAYSDLKPISGIIGLKTTSGSASNGWKASLSEQPSETDSSVKPSDFDAYNLVLTGSGSATIVVKWNTEYISLNKYFIDSAKRVYNFASGEVTDPVDEGNGWKSITINANTGDDTKENRNRYTIQLYKTGVKEPENWNFFANNKPAGSLVDAWIRVNIT